MAVRNAVMKSLQAIGSSKEAAFYTQLFQQQEPEKFALIVIDPRCLKNPLFEILISDLKFLSDLDLTPVLLVGAFEEDMTNARFQSQRLCSAFDKAKIPNTRLNCASYEIIPSIRKSTRNGQLVVLEQFASRKNDMVITAKNKRSPATTWNLHSLVHTLKPFKVIFLQPSGGFRIDGKRLAVVNIDDIGTYLDEGQLSAGQRHFIDTVHALASDVRHHCTYVMASPLNLLSELFTIKGAGTLLRRSANIMSAHQYNDFALENLKASIEKAFGRRLIVDIFNRPVIQLCIEENYRGGAIVIELADLPYLSKFWVMKEAQGEGIATDIWQELETNVTKFFWRSRKSNSFNDWYMKICDGMQVSGEWRVFWKGLDASEIQNAIRAASILPVDFE